jgi:hypothetical protein
MDTPTRVVQPSNRPPQPVPKIQFDKPKPWFSNSQVAQRDANSQINRPHANLGVNAKPSVKTADSNPSVTGTSDYGQDHRRNMVVNTVTNPKYICKQLKVPDCCNYISDPKLRQDCVDQWKTICKPT